MGTLMLLAASMTAPEPETLIARWQGTIPGMAIFWLQGDKMRVYPFGGPVKGKWERLAPLPRHEAELRVAVVKGREKAYMKQHPEADSNYAALFLINDHLRGSGEYTIEIRVVMKQLKPAAPEADIEMQYKGKGRTRTWVNTWYRKFRDRIIDVDGTGPVILPSEKDALVKVVVGEVIQVQGPRKVLISRAKIIYSVTPDGRPAHEEGRETFYYYVTNIETAGMVDGQAWSGDLLRIGTHTYASADGAARTVPHCIPAKGPRHTLTREQFVEALKGGLDLPGVD